MVNNKKPVEIVQELKEEYQIPSYEEFMKDYQADDNLNYEDLSSDDLGSSRGYGPCEYLGCSYSCRFYFQIGFDSEK
jgi:hypothetical protein